MSPAAARSRMNKSDQYEIDMKSAADACQSLSEAYHKANVLGERINSDFRAFEQDTGQNTMQKRESIRGRITRLKDRPDKGPFAAEFLDKLDEVLCRSGGQNGFED